MKIEHPNARAITPEENQELEYLRIKIERAIEDGIITRIELESIKAIMFANSTHNAAQINRQVTLYRHLVSDKINTDELIIEAPQ
jgi:hypothetical protein